MTAARDDGADLETGQSGDNANRAAGVVLAGGASRRMGRDKATLLLGGETLLARVVRRLRAATGEVVVIGPPERAAIVPGVQVVADEEPGLGPLGGLVTALRVTQRPYVFLVACDMPFVQPGLARLLLRMAAGYDVVVPRSDRGTEQLHAVYGRACLLEAEALLAAGDRAIGALFGRVRTRVVEPEEWAPYDPDGLSSFNANTPDEWQRAKRLLARSEAERAW